MSFRKFLERRAQSEVVKTVERKFGNQPLHKQVRAMRNLIAAAAGVPGSSYEKAVVNVRANLLKKRGIPGDIRGMAKKGKTQSEIKDYYWQCEDFVSFWTNDLKMEEETLDELIRQTLEGE